jgi:hypothetical protein
MVLERSPLQKGSSSRAWARNTPAARTQAPPSLSEHRPTQCRMDQCLTMPMTKRKASRERAVALACAGSSQPQGLRLRESPPKAAH